MNKRKVCFLVTSPDKSQPSAGDGSLPTDSHTPTGKRIAAILRKTTASSSPTVSLSDSHKDGLSLWVIANGGTTEIDTATVKSSVQKWLDLLRSSKT